MADVTLLMPNHRPIVAKGKFEYRGERLVRLERGNNFVTWSGPNTRVTTAFSTLAGSSLRVYSWSVARQHWRIFATHLPPSLNTLRTLRHGQPLWIALHSDDVDWLQAANE